MHAFSVNSDVMLKKFFSRNILYYVSETGVKILTVVKELKTVFNVFIFSVLQKQCLQILTICLQGYSYQIYFIQWFYENWRSIDKICAIKTNSFESDIIRARNFYF